MLSEAPDEDSDSGGDLHSSSRMLRSIYEQSPIAIQIYNESGILIDVNQRTLELFGVTSKQHLLGHRMRDSPSYTPETLAAVRRGESVHIETSLDFEEVKKVGLFPTIKSGTIELDLYVFPLVADGRIAGYSVQLVDLTNHKRVESQLLQAQKMEALGRLAGGIAHDFNNILVPIAGFSELALTELSPNDDLFSGMTQIQSAAERGAQLAQKVLAFSRKQVLEFRALDLNLVVSEFEDRIRRLIGENIQLTVLKESDLPQVRADRLQIEQVLMNLVVNARDAMPGGGVLTIETANAYLDGGKSNYGLSPNPGRHVSLTVSDSGYGMNEETLEKIFEPFFTTKEQGEGSGLGLSITFGVVKQHGGALSVSSRPGKGSSFTIFLPLAEATPDEEEELPVTAGSARGTETILVVEDDVAVRKLVQIGLTAFGYNVIEAEDPSDAVRLAVRYRGRIDLLLTDVVMPGMSGTELYRHITKISPRVKVLFMSGSPNDSGLLNEALDDKVEFLQEPFNISRLTAMIRRTLDRDKRSL